MKADVELTPDDHTSGPDTITDAHTGRGFAGQRARDHAHHDQCDQSILLARRVEGRIRPRPRSWRMNASADSCRTDLCAGGIAVRFFFVRLATADGADGRRKVCPRLPVE